MWKIVLLLAGVFVAVKYPTFTKWCYSVPILGFMFGGFVWCVLGMYDPSFVTAKAFGIAVFIGMAVMSLVIGDTK